MRHAPKLASLSFLFLTFGTAAADEPIVWRVNPRIMPGIGPQQTVDEIRPDGTIRLKAGAALPDQLRVVLGGVAEGYYLLVARTAQNPAGPAILRVQVTDVAADGGVTVATTPEAAARLKVGDGVDLTRPFGSTTALLRGLPAVIPMAGQGNDQDDPAEAARQLQARAQSTNNLKQIGLALHNFYSANDCFPPAVIFGPDGKPWHSWRVLILPYLEQAQLYNEYDFGQPWDSPKNRKVLEKMPAVFRDPVYGDAKGTFTHYAGLLGENTLFSPDGPEQKDPKNPPIGEKGMRMQEITDGTSNTLLVVPVDPKAEIPWTKPEDILVLPEFPGLGRPGGIAAPYKMGPKKDDPRGAPVLFADGSVRMIGDTIKGPILSALITRNGGEVIDFNAIPGGNVNNQVPILTIRIADGKAIASYE